MTATTTTLGTPASPKWDDDWLARVDRVEQHLGYRICGAHTPAWTPCKLASTHPNGRCRFHGGAQGIGAPDGNRNAWVHGLYSRRLQQCGQHCPLWNHCPMAGDDVLDLRPTERPHCVYEQDEYDTTLAQLRNTNGPSPRGMGGPPMQDGSETCSDTSDGSTLDDSPSPSFLRKQESLDIPKSDPEDRNTHPPHAGPSSIFDSPATHSSGDSCVRRNDAEGHDPLRASASPRDPNLIERNVALFQVMLTRAQSALRIHPLTDETEVQSNHYQMRSTRVGALLQAQLHIARELRQWLKLLPGFTPDPRPRSIKPATPPKTDPPKPKGLPEIMQPILQEAEVVFDELFGPGGFPGRMPKPQFNDPPPKPA